MTRPFRLLDDTTTPAVSTPTDTSSSSQTFDSDLMVILAAILCSIMGVLGLIMVARCAWTRCLSASSSSSTSSVLPTHRPYSAKAANKGIKKKTLRSLPKLTFSPDKKFSDCTICLATFVDGDEFRILPQCGHAFHVSCIDTWLGSHSSCPSCRRILVFSDKIDIAPRCERCGNVQASSNSSCSGSRSGDGGVDNDGTKRIDDGDADSGSNNMFMP